MSAARTFLILISLLGLLTVTFYTGCSPDRTGSPTPNAKPEVSFTNTPPDSAQFSRNPELNWFGTDIDGYITFFRYAVVVDSMMLVNDIEVPPDEFADQATDDQFGWDTLLVDLDHPQSTATVRLYANVDFPVDSFVTQYVFIQACDDRGALSEIKYRMYSRNNHFPNTHYRSSRYYINAKDAASPAPGISMTWDGADSTDWGRAEPPLEFEWRLYGPFEADAPIYVNIVKENCIYDPTVDSFINCINTRVLDLDRLPPVVQDVPQPLVHSKGPNFNNDPTDVWVTDRRVTLYDVFRDLELTETSKYKFCFWVRARDDGFVPDPTPSFSQFYVYEAKFENSVMVIDETGYDRRNGRWGPIDMDTVKAYFYNALHEVGYTDFDTNYNEDRNPPRPDHYFYSAPKQNAGPGSSLRDGSPTLLDVLAHKVIVYYHDDVDLGPKEGEFGLMKYVFDGVDMGASAWMMARNMGGASTQTDPRTEFGKSLEFSLHFGISLVVAEGWLGTLFDQENPGVFNEENIGSYSNIPETFPHLYVDYGVGSLLDIRYPKMFVDTTHVMTGSPEIGVGTRTAYSAPAYLYLSKNGDRSYFHGKVNGVLQQLGDMRTACFMFTPLAMEQEPMQDVFNEIMPWLAAKFDGEQAGSKLQVPSYKTSFSSIEERRARIDRLLKYLSEDATQEERDFYGVDEPEPPIVVPASDIR